jgi:hypothetical protein
LLQVLMFVMKTILWKIADFEGVIGK